MSSPQLASKSTLPPFVVIPGVHNVRDIGSLASTTSPGHVVVPNKLFRGGALDGVTEEGKARIAALGVTKVFDLRAEVELKSKPTPVIPGVEVIHAPVIKEMDYSPEGVAKAYQTHADSKGFEKTYSEMLEEGGPAFALIFKHIRDAPEEPCIFNCSAGKDRTGVASALILRLGGVSKELIAKDYALTQVGYEVVGPFMIARFEKDPVFVQNREAAMRMMGSTYETMIEFLEMLDNKYGGIEAYLSKYTDLTSKDVSKIKANLLVAPPEGK